MTHSEVDARVMKQRAWIQISVPANFFSTVDDSRWSGCSRVHSACAKSAGGDSETWNTPLGQGPGPDTQFYLAASVNCTACPGLDLQIYCFTFLFLRVVIFSPIEAGNLDDNLFQTRSLPHSNIKSIFPFSQAKYIGIPSLSLSKHHGFRLRQSVNHLSHLHQTLVLQFFFLHCDTYKYFFVARGTLHSRA